MNKSASKKTLIASAAAISLSALLFAGTTYAWFTDSASSAVSTIQSGNLDVNLYQLKNTTATDEDGNKTETSTYEAVTGSDIVFANNTEWEPGAVEVVYLKVANEGTLALTYNLSLPIYENIHATSVTNADIDLSTVLKAAVVKLDDSVTFDSRAEAIAAAEKGTSVTLGTSSALTGNLDAKTGDTFAIVVYMPETTGNEANHNANGAPSIKVGVNVAAKQYTKESDSYNDQYDANAGYPVAASDFASLLKSGGNLALTENVSVVPGLGAQEIINVADGSVVDLQNNTVTCQSEGLALTGSNITIKNGIFNLTADSLSGSRTLTIGALGDNYAVTENVVLDGVTIEGSLSVYNADQVILRNCTINGVVGNSDSSTGSGEVSDSSTGSSTTTSTTTTDTAMAADNTTFVTGLYNYPTSIIIESGTYTEGDGGLVFGASEEVQQILTIKGGTFNVDPTYTGCVAEGYTVVASGDGWYTVVPETAD